MQTKPYLKTRKFLQYLKINNHHPYRLDAVRNIAKVPAGIELNIINKTHNFSALILSIKVISLC